MLNEIRLSNLSEKTVNYLQSLVVRPSPCINLQGADAKLSVQAIADEDIDENVPFMCPRRAQREEINRKCIEKVAGDLIEFQAVDTLESGDSEIDQNTKKAVQKIRERNVDVLQLKIGCRVMLVRYITKVLVVHSF